MLQDRLEALLLVSIEKDILLALTNDLHKGCIFLTNSKLFTFCTTYFPRYTQNYYNIRSSGTGTHEEHNDLFSSNLKDGGWGSAQLSGHFSTRTLRH